MTPNLCPHCGGDLSPVDSHPLTATLADINAAHERLKAWHDAGPGRWYELPLGIPLKVTLALGEDRSQSIVVHEKEVEPKNGEAVFATMIHEAIDRAEKACGKSPSQPETSG